MSRAFLGILDIMSNKAGMLYFPYCALKSSRRANEPIRIKLKGTIQKEASLTRKQILVALTSIYKRQRRLGGEMEQRF